jgi:hypothetical protein
LSNARFLTLAVLIASLGHRVSGQTVLRHVDDGRVVDQVIILADNPSYEAVKQFALQFLEPYNDRRAIVRLIVASNREDASRSIGRDATNSPGGYERAVEALKARKYPTGPVGQAFAMRGSAILSYRSGDELRTEILFGREDPSRIEIGGLGFQILHLRLAEVPHSGGKKSDYNFQVFAKALNSLSAAAVGELTRRFQRLTTATTIFVDVRPDVWFFENSEFPEVLPWVRVEKPPTKLEYMVSHELDCMINVQKLTCNGSNFEP